MYNVEDVTSSVIFMCTEGSMQPHPCTCINLLCVQVCPDEVVVLRCGALVPECFS